MKERQLADWLANLMGGTLRQQAFYTQFFRELLEKTRVYAADMQKWGWHRRSVEEWRRRLIENEVIIQKREGWKGRVYYSFHPQFYANIVKLAKLLKSYI